MTPNPGRRIAWNALTNVVRALVMLPITLLLTPYIVRMVGPEGFGIWALAGVVASYAQLSDFGITESLVKLLAEYKA